MIKAQAEDTQAPPPSGGGRKPMSPSDRARHASLVRWGKEQPFAARLAAVRERRKAKKKAPKAAKPTAEQRLAEKEAKLEANRQKVYSDVGLMEDAAGALTDLAKGTPTDDDGGLVKLGLAEQAGDGSYRLTPAGRQLFNAASRGDLGAARDTLSRAKDKAGAASSEEEKEPTSGGGGGGSGAKKPTPEEKKQQREQEKTKEREANRGAVRDAMAQSDQGLAPAGFDNLMKLSEGVSPDKVGAEGLISMGVAERGSDGTLRLTPAGRMAVNAANRGDVKQAIDAVSRGADRVGQAKERDTERATQEKEREAATAARETERTARETERERVRTARKERVQNVALRRLDRTGKLSDRQAADLEEAGLVEFDDKGAPRLTEAGRQRLRKPPEEKKALDFIKHGAHDQSTHGRRRGGGGRGVTSTVLPADHPMLKRFGHDTGEYREFDDPSRADAAMNRMYEGWAKSLSEEEQNAVRGYQQQTFGLVNDTLRGHRPPDDKTPFAREQIKMLDNALDSSDVPYNMTVYRGMVNPRLSEGDVFEDAGYGSTTFAPAIASARAQGHGDQGVMARIRVPQGTKGAYIETVTAIDQAELLLHRGTRYRVTGESDGMIGGKNTRILDLEVID